MSVENKIFRLRSCIAIVCTREHVEFFDSNLRTRFSISLDYPNIVELLHSFDGLNEVNKVLTLFPEVNPLELFDLISFLHKKMVLIEVNNVYDEITLNRFPRLINSLESYFCSTSEVAAAMCQAAEARVLIIGLGAVGSSVLHCLVKAGVKNIAVLDDDIVDASNLHRQDLFFDCDIGKSKVSAAHDNIRISYGLKINPIQRKMISSEDLEDIPFIPSLVINCADYPSVDLTSRIVSDYCLKNKIPHIIGGGYNLHLTLVGQVVVPGVTACFHCFDEVLSPMNNAELFGVRKINRKFRKIGSLGPVCGISASITSNEAIKIVFGVPIKFLGVINKRLEFNLENFDFGEFSVQRNPECNYCS